MFPVKSSIKVSDLTDDGMAKVAEAKSKKKHLRHRKLLITVNSNKRFKDWDDTLKPFVSKFKEALGEVFDEDKLPKFLHLKDNQPATLEHIKYVESACFIERGLVKGCVHAHGWIHIAYYSLVYLDYAACGKAISDKLGSVVYFHVDRSINDTTLSFEQYAAKYHIDDSDYESDGKDEESDSDNESVNSYESDSESDNEVKAIPIKF